MFPSRSPVHMATGGAVRASRRRRLVVALGVLLTACGKDSVNEPEPPPPPLPPAVVARVEIGRQSGSDTLAIQGTTTLTDRRMPVRSRPPAASTAGASIARVLLAMARPATAPSRCRW